MSDSVRPHRRRPARLPHPWDSPGKNTGVGCHFLLQCMKGNRSVLSDSLRPHGLQPTTLLCPWDFLGKSTWSGVPIIKIQFLLFYHTKTARQTFTKFRVYLEQSDFNYGLHGVNLMMLRCDHIQETEVVHQSSCRPLMGAGRPFFALVQSSVPCSRLSASRNLFIIYLTMVNDFSEELWKGRLASHNLEKQKIGK